MGVAFHNYNYINYYCSYYQLESSSQNLVNQFLTKIVNDALMALHDSYCISFNEVIIKELIN